MKALVRLAGVIENLRGSLWLLPAASILAALALGGWLSGVEVGDESPLRHVVFPGGPEGARAVLQAVATSVITVTSLVFSLTVVTLQLASTQYSPRLLRTFLRLPGNQVVLGTFIATFVYSLVVLRSVRAADPAYVPELAVSVGFLLVLASVVALVYFISHITTEIRVDTLMWRVEHDTVETIDRVHPDPFDHDAPGVTLPQRPVHAVPLPAPRSGIVQAVAAESLRRLACEHDLTILLGCRVGDHVVADGTLAWAWADDDERPLPALRGLADEVNQAVRIGRERTLQQDISYGIRQLVDMAVKAMSPGINDPTTAVDAVGHLASVLAVLVRRRVEPLVLADESGKVRLALDRPSFEHYTERTVGQIRRYAAAEPDVLLALLDLCRELGDAAVVPWQAEVLREQVQLVVSAARRSVAEPRDLRRVEQAAADVEHVLAGARPPATAAVRGDG